MKTNGKENLRAGISFMGKRKLRYLSATVLSSVITSFCYNIVLAIVMKYVIDAIQFQKRELFVRGLMLAIGSFLVAFILEPITSRVKKAVVRELTADIRIDLVRHIVGLPARQYESLHSGEIVTIVMQDVQKIEELYLSCIPMLCFALIHGFAAMLFMLYYHAGLGILAILLGLIQIMVSRKTSRNIRRAADERQKEASSLLQQVIETLDGREDIEGCNAQQYFMQRFAGSSTRLGKKEWKAQQASGNVSVVDNLLNLGNRLILMGVGLVCVRYGYLSVGIIAAILNLQGNATFLFQNYTSFSVKLANCIPSVERIVNLLKMESEHMQTQKNNFYENIEAPESLALENIDFSYEQGQKVLNGLTMHFEKGKFYCIVGESGSGKSTIQKILLKFYEPQDGSYKIGNVSCEMVSYNAVRKLFAYVEQNENLFAMSIVENLKLVREDASQQEIIEACKAAEAHDFIVEQGGYDYEIDSSGNNLSGGQKQRIELAKMFLSDRPIWLIDEGTAHLDKDTEKKVMQHIIQHKKDKIIIMVTHHRHLLDYADVVYACDSSL